MRKFNIVCVVIAAASLVTACGGKQETATQESATQENATQEAVTQETADLAEVNLEAVAAANTVEALLNNHKNFTRTNVFYDDDENEYVETYYQDGSYYIEKTGDADLFVKDGEELYGYSSEQEKPYRVLMLNGSFDSYYEGWLQNPVMSLAAGETLVSSEEKDGKLLLTTTMDRDSLEAEGVDVSELAEDDVELEEYVLDAETLELQYLESWIQKKDGTRTSHDLLTVSHDVEPWKEPEELLKQLNDKDSRTLTVIMNPGTPEEKVFTSTAGKGCLFQYYLPEGYETVYRDATCTQIFEGPGDAESDLTLYTVSAVSGS